MSAPYRTVLFDLDGTLLDTIETIVSSLRHALRSGLDGFDPGDEALVAGVGTPLVEQLQGHARVALGLDEPTDDLVRRLMEAYLCHNHAAHDATVRSYAGVPEVLDALSRRGLALAIVTSKAHWIARRGLEICGLSEHFPVLIGAEDVRAHKPHPAPVLAALEALGRPAAGAVFVGDSPHDMRAGRRAGVDTGAALWGPFSRAALEGTEPSLWLQTPEDLLSLVHGRPLPHQDRCG